MKRKINATSMARRRFPLRMSALVLTGILLGSLSACGGDKDAAPEDQPANAIEATAEPVELLATETAVPEAATEEPASPTPEATATEEPTAAPATAVPATAGPTSPPAPTAAPANAWSVEFYPDNWTYQLTKDQLCTGLNWNSTGVTELVLGREGFGSGEKVEATGSKGDVCFPERDAEFYLEYRKPDGQVERKTVRLERTKNN
jgi:hypothetical protein